MPETTEATRESNASGLDLSDFPKLAVLTKITDRIGDYAELLFGQMVAAVVHEIANRRMRGGRREHKWAERLLSKTGEDWDADKAATGRSNSITKRL